MKQAEESVSRSTCETLLRPSAKDHKFHMLRAFGLSAQIGLTWLWNELICQLKLAILETFKEGPDKPFVAKKIHSKVLATSCSSYSTSPIVATAVSDFTSAGPPPAPDNQASSSPCTSAAMLYWSLMLSQQSLR